jgi:hypothetical protein
VRTARCRRYCHHPRCRQTPAAAVPAMRRAAAVSTAAGPYCADVGAWQALLHLQVQQHHQQHAFHCVPALAHRTPVITTCTKQHVPLLVLTVTHSLVWCCR